MGYEDRAQQPILRMFGGLNTKDSELGLPGNDSPSMDNVDLHPEGSIKSRLGSLQLTTPSGETQVNAIMVLTQPEQDRGWVYVIADGTIYRTVEPGTWSWATPTHGSGYTLVDQDNYGRENSRYYDHAGTTEHASVLYLPRSNGAPLIALGQTSATGDIITLPTGIIGTGGAGTGTRGYPSQAAHAGLFPVWKADNWPTHMRLIGLGHGSRMFAWGFHDNPNMLAYSELDVPYNFLQNDIDDPANPQPLIDGGYAMIREGDGDKIIAVVDMFAYKVIFKRFHTLIYAGDPGNDNTWSLQAEFPVGCVSDRAWKKVGNDILFWSDDGPRSLSAVQEYGDLAHSNLAFKINDLVRLVAPGKQEKVCCYHDITNLRIVWFVPSPAATRNDTAFVYYYVTNKWTKWTGRITDLMDVEVIRSNDQNVDRFIGGTYEDGITQVQSGRYDFYLAGTNENIDSEYITNWVNFGEVSDSSRVLSMDLLYGDDGPMVDIYYQTDLNPTWTQITRIEKSMGGSGSYWGGGIQWGYTAWGATARAFRRYELTDVFNLVRFKFMVSGTNGFEVMGYRPEARMKGLRA